ncbi:hypothetical protein U1872_13605 [Sphingomonas sp. RB3P16]|uniref:hypothetical protein n=1 Tax=Parasphingomonas frigoris TaxID=3096163 RepID=UPI002FCC88F7
MGHPFVRFHGSAQGIVRWFDHAEVRANGGMTITHFVVLRYPARQADLPLRWLANLGS